jgi:hypothetical protein
MFLNKFIFLKHYFYLRDKGHIKESFFVETFSYSISINLQTWVKNPLIPGQT